MTERTAVSTNERGPYIVTYPTRTAFTFMDPQLDQIFLADIAHSLSLQCRFIGHIARHYSVLEHSLSVAHEVFMLTHSAIGARCAALHDSEEAYTSDLPTPIKRNVPLFEEIGARIRERILERFGLAEHYWKWASVIKEVDDRMLHTESIQLSHGATWEDPKRALDQWQIPRSQEEWAIGRLQTALRYGTHTSLCLTVKEVLEHLQSGGHMARVRERFTADYEQWATTS